jgi:hypothetical protein
LLLLASTGAGSTAGAADFDCVAADLWLDVDASLLLLLLLLGAVVLLLLWD